MLSTASVNGFYVLFTTMCIETGFAIPQTKARCMTACLYKIHRWVRHTPYLTQYMFMIEVMKYPTLPTDDERTIQAMQWQELINGTNTQGETSQWGYNT